MTDLAGRRVMVLEDSYLLAREIGAVLEGAGASVIGPFGSVGTALRSVGAGMPDCAVLDVNLGESPSFDVARKLRQHRVPFLFFTGYDADVIPAEFAGVDRLQKPADPALLVTAVERCCRSTPSRD